MTLTALTHVKHVTGAPAANTVAGWLDAIYDQLNGAMTHWTVARYQNGGATECVYLTPKAGQALTKNVRIMIAGADSGTPAPTMSTNSIYANSKLFMALVIGAGVFSAWNSATPFTSHDYFSGFAPVGACAAFTAQAFDIFESAETLFVRGRVASGGDFGGGLAGAVIDPESTVAANASATADERVYGILTGGDSNSWSNLNGLGATGAVFSQSNSATLPKALVLDSTGTWREVNTLGGGMGNNNLIQADGSPWLMPIYCCRNTTPFVLYGRLREVYWGPRIARDVDIYDSTPTKKALGAGCDPITAYSALCFKAA